MMTNFLKPVEARWRQWTRDSRLLPDFLVIGAQRCGTSTLYQYLIQHPCIGGAARKEVSFFDRHFERGLDWYRAQFPTEREKAAALARQPVFLTGESTPNYLLHPTVPGRVAAALPGVRLLVILRDPVERSYSNYHRTVRKGRETRSFAEAVASQIEDPLSDWNEALRRPEHDFGEWRFRQYLSRGLYAHLLEHWLKFFPRDRLLALSGEEFFKEPRVTLNRVCDFLGIPGWTEAAFQSTAAQPTGSWLARKYDYKNPPMEEAVRRQLREFYRPQNQRLYALIGQDFGWDA